MDGSAAPRKSAARACDGAAAEAAASAGASRSADRTADTRASNICREQRSADRRCGDHCEHRFAHVRSFGRTGRATLSGLRPGANKDGRGACAVLGFESGILPAAIVLVIALAHVA